MRQIYIGADIELESVLSEALTRQGFVLIEDRGTLAQVGPRLQNIVPQRRRYWEESRESGPFFFHHAQGGVSVGMALWEAAQLAEMAEANVSVCSPDAWLIIRVNGVNGEDSSQIRERPALRDIQGQVIMATLDDDLTPALGALLNQYAPHPEAPWKTETQPISEDPAIQNYRLNQAWLKEHAQQYSGEWVALYEGNLLAHGPKYKEVRDAVASQHLLDQALLMEV